VICASGCRCPFQHQHGPAESSAVYSFYLIEFYKREPPLFHDKCCKDHRADIIGIGPRWLSREPNESSVAMVRSLVLGGVVPLVCSWAGIASRRLIRTLSQ
jgi:hypothetical protein